MTYPFRITLERPPITRDITPHTLSLRWRIGMNRPYESTAAPSSGEIVLENRDRAASPELDADDLFAPGTAVTIECQYDGWQTLFAGRIAHTAPDMGDRGARRTVITLEGPEGALSRVPAALPVMANLRAGDIIGTVLDLPPLDAIPRQLESGASVFAYAGDRWDGLSADAAIRQAADAERGRFYTSRDGTLTFRGRHAGLSDVSPHAAFDSHADDARMIYGGALVNHVSIGLRPRALGAPASVLWTLGQRTRYADALALTLFDRVRVIDAQTGHDRVYTIIGESHIVTAGGTRHSVVWTLEPAPLASYWTVGVSPLGTATRLAV